MCRIHNEMLWFPIYNLILPSFRFVTLINIRTSGFAMSGAWLVALLLRYATKREPVSANFINNACGNCACKCSSIGHYWLHASTLINRTFAVTADVSNTQNRTLSTKNSFLNNSPYFVCSGSKSYPTLNTYMRTHIYRKSHKIKW